MGGAVLNYVILVFYCWMVFIIFWIKIKKILYFMYVSL